VRFFSKRKKKLSGFFLMVLLFWFRELHREQMSIEHSMQDLDSAVGKLDNILMFLYGVIAIVIIAVALVINSFLTFSVWFVHPFFSSSGNPVDYNRYGCWHLDSRFVSSIVVVLLTLSLCRF
jgi:hypothetical protein